MEHDLHPLCTLFPRLSGDDISSLKSFTGVRKNPPALAFFCMSKRHHGFWDYQISACDDGDYTSKQPIASHGVAIVLDSFGGRDKWELSVPNKADDPILPQSRLTQATLHCAEGNREYVYFLRAGGFIKIGKTSGNPNSRIATLQTGCPFNIELAAWEFGGLDREKELHCRFGGLRANGEWFRDEGELSEYVISLSGESA